MASPALSVSAPADSIPLWLFERRRLPKDWGKKLKAIQGKRDELLKAIAEKDALKATEIPAFLKVHESRMTLKVLEELERLLIASDESKERGIFGNYTSPLIKGVRVLIGMLKKDNLYLADIGSELTHRIEFVLPALKKQIAQYEKQIKDEAVKATEATKSSAEAMENYKKECRTLGVNENEDLEKGIIALVKELPEIFNKTIETAQKGDIAIFEKYYRDYLLGNKLIDEASQPTSLLKIMAEHGDLPASIIQSLL